MTDLKCAICGSLVNLEAEDPYMVLAAIALQEYLEQNPNNNSYLICDQCEPKDLPLQPFYPVIGSLN